MKEVYIRWNQQKKTWMVFGLKLLREASADPRHGTSKWTFRPAAWPLTSSCHLLVEAGRRVHPAWCSWPRCIQRRCFWFLSSSPLAMFLAIFTEFGKQISRLRLKHEDKVIVACHCYIDWKSFSQTFGDWLKTACCGPQLNHFETLIANYIPWYSHYIYCWFYTRNHILPNWMRKLSNVRQQYPDFGHCPGEATSTRFHFCSWSLTCRSAPCPISWPFSTTALVRAWNLLEFQTSHRAIPQGVPLDLRVASGLKTWRNGSANTIARQRQLVAGRSAMHRVAFERRGTEGNQLIWRSWQNCCNRPLSGAPYWPVLDSGGQVPRYKLSGSGWSDVWLVVSDILRDSYYILMNPCKSQSTTNQL